MNKNKEELKTIILRSVYKRFHKISQVEVANIFEDKESWIMDFRNVSLTPDFLHLYTEIFFKLFEAEKDYQICGLESAAIPLVSALVMESFNRSKPVNGMFVRKGRKKHDLMKNVEGQDNGNDVIIVDDIINTGSSIIKQIETLRSENIKVKKVFCILRFRDDKFYDFLRKEGIELTTLFELNDFSSDIAVQNIVTVHNHQRKPLNMNVLWKFKSEGANFKYVVPKSAPVIFQDKIYFGTDSGVFYCLNKETGSVVWQFTIFQKAEGKAIFSSPIIAENKVIFGAYDGNLYALNVFTGKTEWIYLDADWIGSSPCYSRKLGIVYVGLEYGLIGKKGGLAAIRVADGKEMWKDTHKGLTHGSPYVSDKTNMVFVGCNDGLIRVYNSKNGHKLLEYDCGSEVKYSFAENEDGTLVSVGDMSGNLYIIDTGKMSVDSFFQARFGIYSTPIFYKNRIIFNSLDKNIYCVDTKSRNLIWSKVTAGRIFSTPVIHKNHLYTGSNDGRLYKIEITSGEIEGYIQFSERIVSCISFEESGKDLLLYVPTVANEIYCIKVPNL